MWQVLFYSKEDGSSPVEAFLNSLPVKAKAKSAREIGLLQDFGSNLREPYSKHLSDGIFELRIRFSSDNYRIFYFFCRGRTVILTNGFLKKTNKIPERELKKALIYKADFERRFPHA